MKNENLRKIFFFTICMLGLSLYACDGKTEKTRGVTKDEIVIGTHTPLSGPVSGWGIGVANAIRMRFDEENETGGIHGRKIRYIVEDSQYRVPIAVQKANKLINRDKVFALLASMGTSINNAIFKIQLPQNVLSLFPYSFAASMSEPHHRLKFALAATYYDQMTAALKYFVKEKGKRRVCIMYQDTDYGVEIVNIVSDKLKADNMEVVGKTSHKPTEINFTAPISKLRKAECDLVILGTLVVDTVLAVTAARKIEWDVDMVGGTPICNTIVAEKGGAAVEGLYSVTGFEIMYEEEATGKAKAFFQNFRKRYGKIPNEGGQSGYLAADLTVLALRKAGKNLTLDSFIKGLESISSYPSMFNGPTRSFGAEKHKGTDESMLVVIKNGKWVSPTGQKIFLSH